MASCIRELVWDGQQWAPVWHLARGQEGDNPRAIACGEGAYYTIVDPSPAVDREPTCEACSD